VCIETATPPTQVGGDAEDVQEVAGEVEKRVVTGDEADQKMDDAGVADGGGPCASPATVFRIRLKQPPSSLRHKMRVPELCRNFRCTLELSCVIRSMC
jgi:hypothetical protein